MFRASRAYKLIAVVVVFIFPSPVISDLTQTSHLELFLPLGAILAGWAWLNGVTKPIALVSLMVAIWGLIASLISQSVSQAGIALIIMLSVTIAACLKVKSMDLDAISLMNKIVIAMLIGGWLSLIYFFSGGQPMFEISNPDGRPNLLFLSSFTNSADYEFWKIIRPSGIYDEAGALSFAVTLLVVFNELTRPRGKPALTMMLLGLITLSLAHALLLLLYLLYFFNKPSRQLLILLSVILLAAGGLVSDESPLARNFLARFSVQDGRVQGDNRTHQIQSFFEIAKNDVEISTKGHRSITRDSSANRYEVDQSSNPFSMWFNYGVMMWLIYLATMISILWVSLKNTRHSNVMISGVLLFLLLLQRPYLYEAGWGVGVWLAILMLHDKRRSRSTLASTAISNRHLLLDRTLS